MPELQNRPSDRETPHRIGIIRFSALGDIIHTLPAFTLLRRAFAESHITWFVHPPGARLLTMVRGLDAIEPVTLKGIPLARRLRQLHQTVKSFRHRLDLVIDFQGLIKSALFAALLGGRRLGFARSELRESLAGWWYTESATPFTGAHVIDRNIHLLSSLDIAAKPDDDYSLNITPPSGKAPDERFILDLVRESGKALCLINLGGNWSTKQYEVDFWTDLLESLHEGIKPVLIWGSPSEHQLAEAIASRKKVMVSPFLTFSNLTWLIANAGAVVSSDSLALHLADAVKVPSIGLFGPTNPARNGSRLKQSRTIRAEVPCPYCYQRECDKMWCRQKLSPMKAAALTNEVMEQDA